MLFTATKRWFLITVVILAMTVLFAEAQAPTYIEKQLLCALDQAPCDLLGSQIKDALPEIIGRNCQACDQRQYNNARRITRFVQARYPRAWAALVQKYSSPSYDE